MYNSQQHRSVIYLTFFILGTFNGPPETGNRNNSATESKIVAVPKPVIGFSG
jgi:hypothetical protein